ncbi:MAG: flagellin [Bdellovibrionales bacterium RIFOXYD1_FULL_44_7]|nr:MAG: flagellin [Bdellovibrionales bacterium RIFOXYD1_FULL_44_7]
MGMRINTNTQALAAQRTLARTSGAQQSSLEKLSSGTRIVRSADDAAGLAVAEKMKAEIRSVRQAVRNANDGISIVQATEGGLNEITNIMMRFRELSIQAASDTIGDVERGFINKEVTQLTAEIDHIADSIEFNGRIKLMNGQGDPVQIQIGINNTDEDRFTIQQSDIDARTVTLGLEGFNINSKEAAQNNLDKIDWAINTLSEKRAILGAIHNRLECSIRNLQVYDENLSGARSRIYDVDMASETAELVKNNVLSQTGVSLLAQANQNPVQALKLLG